MDDNINKIKNGNKKLDFNFIKLNIIFGVHKVDFLRFKSRKSYFWFFPVGLNQSFNNQIVYLFQILF